MLTKGSVLFTHKVNGWLVQLIPVFVQYPSDTRYIANAFRTRSERVPVSFERVKVLVRTREGPRSQVLVRTREGPRSNA